MTIKYFVYPFGVDGTLLAIPDPTQLSGVMSYQEGFGVDYQLIDTDPASLNIPRDQFNQLMFDITGAVQQIQQNGHPTFITTAMNDGVPFPYAKNAWVYQPVDGNVYYSLVDTNTTVPPSGSWSVVGQTASLYFNYAVDTGSADHYNTAPSPPVPALQAGTFIMLKPTQANTGACDIIVSGFPAKNIKTLTNLDPSAGMISPSGMYALCYDGTNFVLLNPTLGTAAYRNVGNGANQVVQFDNAAKYPANDGSQITNLPTSPQAVKAWVNFEGSSATIRKALNVSSVTRNSMGSYTINFTTPMADANYGINFGVSWNGATNQAVYIMIVSQSTSSCTIFVNNGTSAYGPYDPAIACVTILD